MVRWAVRALVWLGVVGVLGGAGTVAAGKPPPPPSPLDDAEPVRAGGPVSSSASSSPALSFHVRFSLAPRVSEKPPVLTVEVENREAHAVPFVRLPDPVCAAQYLLGLEIRQPDGTPLARKTCAVRKWPGADTRLAPRASERFTVPLSALADAWPPGTYAIDVRWDPTAYNRARGGSVPRMMSSSLDATEFSIVKAPAPVRVKRGETVTLPDGVRFTFEGHSHKDVEKGDSSPLIVGGKLQAGAEPARPFYASLYPERGRLFDVEGYTFELAGYAYDEWMELRYFGRLAPRP